MLPKLNGKKIPISGRRDKKPLQSLLGVDVVVDVLQFPHDTDMGKKLPGKNHHNDSWAIERLD